MRNTYINGVIAAGIDPHPRLKKTTTTTYNTGNTNQDREASKEFLALFVDLFIYFVWIFQ